MVKLNKIYTRTGDNGTTGLVDGSRMAKHDPLCHAIGDVDETNSAIGVAIAQLGDTSEGVLLQFIQNELFDLGADLATPVTDAADPDWALRVTPGQVERLEREIDAFNATLPALDSFVLPGGSAGSSAIHLARAVARRAERSVAAVAVERRLNPAAQTYLNRLSDLLFVLARHVNSREGGSGDIKWVPGASR